MEEGIVNVPEAILYQWKAGGLVPTAQRMKAGEIVELGLDHVVDGKIYREITSYDPEYWIDQADLLAA